MKMKATIESTMNNLYYLNKYFSTDFSLEVLPEDSGTMSFSLKNGDEKITSSLTLESIVIAANCTAMED